MRLQPFAQPKGNAAERFAICLLRVQIERYYGLGCAACSYAVRMREKQRLHERMLSPTEWGLGACLVVPRSLRKESKLCRQ